MQAIEIEGMEFYAHHGCFDEERSIGSRFIVSLYLTADLSKAVVSDKLVDTLDYQGAAEVVMKEMNVASHLIEHVAGRIADSMLKTFPMLQQITVKVSKINPPLPCKTEKVTVQVTKTR